MPTELPEGLQKALEIVGGQRWPEGDEDGLRRMSVAWSDICAAIDKLEAAVERSANDIGTTMHGEFSDAYGKYVTDTLRPLLRELREKTTKHSELAKNTAADIQYVKISIIVQLVIVAATLAFSWLPGIGQAITAAAAATARAVITSLFRTVLQNIIVGAAAGVALEVGLDVAIQGMQMLTGVRTDWNEDFTKGAAIGGALGGAMGGAVYGVFQGLGGFARGGIGDVGGAGVDKVVRGPGAEGAEGVLGQGAKDFLDTTGGKLGFDAANILGQGGAGFAADGATNSALGSEEWNPFSFTSSMADGFEKRGGGSYYGGNGDGGTDTSGLDGLGDFDDVATDLPGTEDLPKTIGDPERSGVTDAQGPGNESSWTGEDSDGNTLDGSFFNEDAGDDGASDRSWLSGTTLGATETTRNTFGLGPDGVDQSSYEVIDEKTAGFGEIAGDDSSVVGSQHDPPAENEQEGHGTGPDSVVQDSVARDSTEWDSTGADAPDGHEFDGRHDFGPGNETPSDSGTQRPLEDIDRQHDNPRQDDNGDTDTSGSTVLTSASEDHSAGQPPPAQAQSPAHDETDPLVAGGGRIEPEDTAQQNGPSSTRFQDQHSDPGDPPSQPTQPPRGDAGNTGGTEIPSTTGTPDSDSAETTVRSSSTDTESTPHSTTGQRDTHGTSNAAARQDGSTTDGTTDARPPTEVDGTQRGTDTTESSRQDRTSTDSTDASTTERNAVSNYPASEQNGSETRTEGAGPSTRPGEPADSRFEQSSRTPTHVPDETTGNAPRPEQASGEDTTAQSETDAPNTRNTTEQNPTPVLTPQAGNASSAPSNTSGGNGDSTGNTTPGRPDTADRTAEAPRSTALSENSSGNETTSTPSRTDLDYSPVNTASEGPEAGPHPTGSEPNAETNRPPDAEKATGRNTTPENGAESSSTVTPLVDRNGSNSQWNSPAQRGNTGPSSSGHPESTTPGRSTTPNADNPSKVRTESSNSTSRSETPRSTGRPSTTSQPTRPAPESGTTRQAPAGTTGDPNRTSEFSRSNVLRDTAASDSAPTRPAPTAESTQRAEVLHGLLLTLPVDSGAVLRELHQLRGDPAASQSLQESFRARTGGMDLWMPLALNLDQPDYFRAMDLLGLPRDYVTGPAQPGAPSTSAPPGMGFAPAYNQSVWNFAGQLVQHNSAGRFDDAMTMLHGVGRDIRALWAIQDAYRTQTGSELSSDLMSTAPWRSHEVLHAMGSYSTDPVSMEQASYWHEQLKRSTFEHHARGRTTIRTDHPEDGCYIRAHLWALDLQRMGAAPSKIFVARINPDLSVRTPYSADALPGLAGQVNWSYHVAPSVIVSTPDGPKLHVLDPSTSDAPVSFDNWLSNMGVDVGSETTQILGGSPQRVQQVLDADFTSDPAGWGLATNGSWMPSGRAMVIASDPSALFFPQPWNPTQNPQSLQDADAQVREYYEDLLVQHNDSAQQRAEDRARLENLLNNVGAIHQSDPGALSIDPNDPNSLSFDPTNLNGTDANGTDLFSSGSFAPGFQDRLDALLNDPVFNALLNDTTGGFDPHAFDMGNFGPNEPGGNGPASNGGGDPSGNGAPAPGSVPPGAPPSDGTINPGALFAPDSSNPHTFSEWNDPRTFRDHSGGSGSRPSPLGIDEDTGSSDRTEDASSREHDSNTGGSEPSSWDRSWQHSTASTADWFEPESTPLRPDQWREQREHTPAHEVATEVRDVRMNSTANDLEFYEGRIRYDLRHMDVAGQGVQEYTFRAHLSPAPTITPEQLRDLRDRLTETVDNLFNQGNRLPSGDQFHARVEFVDTPAEAHDTIHVSGEGHTDQNHWNIHASPNIHAHEIGHYFGLPDESPDPRGALDSPDTRRVFNRGDPPRATDLRTGDPHPSHNSVRLDDGLMGHSVDHDPHLKPRHLWAIENTAHSQGARPDIIPRSAGSPRPENDLPSENGPSTANPDPVTERPDATNPPLRPGQSTSKPEEIELGEPARDGKRESAPEHGPENSGPKPANRDTESDGREQLTHREAEQRDTNQHDAGAQDTQRRDTEQSGTAENAAKPTPTITLTKPGETREQLVDLGNTPGYFQEGKALGNVALTELDTGGVTDRVRQLLPNPRGLTVEGVDAIEPAARQNFESFMDRGRQFPVRVGTEWFEVRVRATPRLPNDLGPVSSATPAKSKVDVTTQSSNTNPRTTTVSNSNSAAFNATGGPLVGPYGSLGAGVPLATPNSSQHREFATQEQRNFRSGKSSSTAEVPVDFDVDIRDTSGQSVRAEGTTEIPGITTGSAELRIPEDVGRMNRYPEVETRTPPEGWGSRLEHPGTEAVVDVGDGFDAIAGQLHPSITRLGAPGRNVLREFLGATNIRNSMEQLQHGWVTSPDLLSPHGSRGTAVQMRASFGRAELVGTSEDTTMRLHESSTTSSSVSATSKSGFEVNAGVGGRAFGLGTVGGGAGITGGYGSSRSSNSVTGVESTSRSGMQVKGNQGLYKVDTTIEVRTPNGRATSFTATSYLRAGLPEAAEQGLPVPPGTRNSITTPTEQRFPPPFLADKATAGDVKVGEHGPMNRVQAEVERTLGRIKGFDKFLPDWHSQRTARETGKHLSDNQERFDNLRKLGAELSPAALRTKLDSLLGPGVRVQLKKRGLFTSDYVNITVKARLGTPEHMGQADQRNVRSIAADSAKWDNSTGVEKGWSAGVEGRVRLLPDTGLTRSVLSPTVELKYSDTTTHKMTANPTAGHQSLLVGDSKSQLFRYPVEFDVEISSYSRSRSWVKRITPGSPVREVPEPKVLARTAGPNRPVDEGVVEIPALRDPMTLWLADSTTSGHDLAEFRPGQPRTRELGESDPSDIRELLSDRNRPKAPNWLHVEAVTHTGALRDEAVRLLDQAADGDGALGVPGSVSRNVLDRFFSPENVKAKLRQFVDHGLVEDGLVHGRRVHDRRGGVAMGFGLSNPRLVSASDGISTENNDVGGFKAGTSTTHKTGWEFNASFNGTARPTGTSADSTSGLGGGALAAKPWSRSKSETHGSEISGSLERNVITPKDARTMLVQLDADVTLLAESHERNVLHNGTPLAEGSVVTLPGGVFLRVSEEQARSLGVLDEPTAAPTPRPERLDVPSTIAREQPSSLGLSAVDDVPDLTRLIDEVRERLGPEGAKLLPESVLNDSMRNLRQLAGLTSRENVTALLDTALDGGVPLLVHRPGVFGRDSYQVMLNAKLGDAEFVDVVNDGVGVDHTLNRGFKDTDTNAEGRGWSGGLNALGGVAPATGEPKLSTTAGTGLGAGTSVGQNHSTNRTESSSKQVGYARKAGGPMARYEVPVRFELTVLRDDREPTTVSLDEQRVRLRLLADNQRMSTDDESDRSGGYAPEQRVGSPQDAREQELRAWQRHNPTLPKTAAPEGIRGTEALREAAVEALRQAGAGKGLTADGTGGLHTLRATLSSEMLQPHLPEMLDGALPVPKLHEATLLRNRHAEVEVYTRVHNPRLVALSDGLEMANPRADSTSDTAEAKHEDTGATSVAPGQGRALWNDGSGGLLNTRGADFKRNAEVGDTSTGGTTGGRTSAVKPDERSGLVEYDVEYRVVGKVDGSTGVVDLSVPGSTRLRVSEPDLAGLLGRDLPEQLSEAQSTLKRKADAWREAEIAADKARHDSVERLNEIAPRRAGAERTLTERRNELDRAEQRVRTAEQRFERFRVKQETAQARLEEARDDPRLDEVSRKADAAVNRLGRYSAHRAELEADLERARNRQPHDAGHLVKTERELRDAVERERDAEAEYAHADAERQRMRDEVRGAQDRLDYANESLRTVEDSLREARAARETALGRMPESESTLSNVENEVSTVERELETARGKAQDAQSEWWRAKSAVDRQLSEFRDDGETEPRAGLDLPRTREVRGDDLSGPAAAGTAPTRPPPWGALDDRARPDRLPPIPEEIELETFHQESNIEQPGRNTSTTNRTAHETVEQQSIAGEFDRIHDAANDGTRTTLDSTGRQETSGQQETTERPASHTASTPPRQDNTTSSPETPLDRVRADRPKVAEDIDGASVRESVLELLAGNKRLRGDPNLRDFVEIAFSDENLRKRFHESAEGSYEVELGPRAGKHGGRISLDLVGLREAARNDSREGTEEFTSSRTHDKAEHSSTNKRSPLGTGGFNIRIPWLHLLTHLQVAGLVNSRDSDLTARNSHEKTTTLTEHGRPSRTAEHTVDYRITLRTPGRFSWNDEVTQSGAADAKVHLTWPDNTARDSTEPWRHPGEIEHVELSGLGDVHRAVSEELGLRVGDPAGRELRDWLHSLGEEVFEGPVRRSFAFGGERTPTEIVVGIADGANAQRLPDVEGTVKHTAKDKAESTSGQANTRQRGGGLWVAGGDITGLTGALAGPSVSHIRSTRNEDTLTSGHERETTSDYRGRLRKQRLDTRYLVRVGNEQREVPNDEPHHDNESASGDNEPNRDDEHTTRGNAEPHNPRSAKRYEPERLLRVDGAATVWTRDTDDGSTRDSFPTGIDRHRVPDRLDAHHRLPEQTVRAITGPVLSKLHADGTLPGKDLPDLAERLNTFVRNHPGEITGGDGLRLPLGSMHPGAPDVFVRGTMDRSGARYLGSTDGKSAKSRLGGHDGHSAGRGHGSTTTAGISGITPASIPNPIGPDEHNNFSGLQAAVETSSSRGETSSHLSGYERSSESSPVHEFGYPTEFEVRIGGRWSDPPDPDTTSRINSDVRVSAPERTGTRFDEPHSESDTRGTGRENRNTGAETRRSGTTDSWQRGRAPRHDREGHLPPGFELETLKPVPGLRRTMTDMLGAITGSRWPGRLMAPFVGGRPPAFDESVDHGMTSSRDRSSGALDERNAALDEVESFTSTDARAARFERAALHRDTTWLQSHNSGGMVGNRELTARADLSTRLDTPRVVGRDDAHRFGGTDERAERGLDSKTKRNRSYRLGLDITHYFSSGNPAALIGPSFEAGGKYTTENAETSKADTAKSGSSHHHSDRGYLVRYDAVHEVRTSTRRSWQDPFRLLHRGDPDERSKWVRVPDAVEVWVPASELHQVGRLNESDIERLSDEDAEHYRNNIERSDTDTGHQQGTAAGPTQQAPRENDVSERAADEERSTVRPPANVGRGSGRVELYRLGAARELLEQVRQRLDGWSREHGRPGARARMLDLAYEALGKPRVERQPSVAKFDAINERVVDDVLSQLGSRHGFNNAVEEMLNGGRHVHLTGDTPFGKVEQLVVLQARPGAGRYQGTLSEHATTDSHGDSGATGRSDQRGWDFNTMIGVSPFYGTSGNPGSVHMHGFTGSYGNKRGFENTTSTEHSATTTGKEGGVRFLHDLTIDMEVYPYARPGTYSNRLGEWFDRLAPRRFGEPWRSSFELRGAARSTVPRSEVLPVDGPAPEPLTRVDGSFRRSRGDRADQPAWSAEAKVRVRPFAAPALHEELGKLAHGDPDLEPPRPGLRPGNASRLHTVTDVGHLRSNLRNALSTGGHTVDLSGGHLESVRINADLSRRELLGEIERGSLTHTGTERRETKSTSQRGAQAGAMSSMDFRQQGLEGAPLRPHQGLVSINRTLGDWNTDESAENSTGEESTDKSEETRYLVRVTPEWELTPSYRGENPAEWKKPLRTGPDEPILLEVDRDGLIRLGLHETEPSRETAGERVRESPGERAPESTSERIEQPGSGGGEHDERTDSDHRPVDSEEPHTSEPQEDTTEEVRSELHSGQTSIPLPTGSESAGDIPPRPAPLTPDEPVNPYAQPPQQYTEVRDGFAPVSRSHDGSWEVRGDSETGFLAWHGGSGLMAFYEEAGPSDGSFVSSTTGRLLRDTPVFEWYRGESTDEPIGHSQFRTESLPEVASASPVPPQGADSVAPDGADTGFTLPNALWRQDDGELYHFSNKPPERILAEGGLLPKGNGTGRHLLDYVVNGHRDTNFMSATRDPEMMSRLRWKNPDRVFGSTYRYLYTFRAPGGIDVNATLDIASPFPDQKEIVFPGGVRAEHVVGYRDVFEDAPSGEVRPLQGNDAGAEPPPQSALASFLAPSPPSGGTDGG
ncbi:hypothetical protein SAMN04487819_11395 [Actinopolyspora alba]|uniref:Uncharacterized protein n=1 Tax=Actinopolyspora alba TaxID=673379 RepID=A0A1I2AGG3_9ACTN|nr:protein-glutamine glutaminase family protein [Actinopolyspora alba]SFE42899.1 hypothetical protein SAMN04487819_11395 [Actinopolyspora alba]